MMRLLLLFASFNLAKSIYFMTYKNRFDCPDVPLSTSVLSSNSCVSGTGKYQSSQYQCREKKVVITTYQNSHDCGLTPGNNTIVIETTEIAAMDKCIKMGKGFIFYDCSIGNVTDFNYLLLFVTMAIGIFLI